MSEVLPEKIDLKSLRKIYQDKAQVQLLDNEDLLRLMQHYQKFQRQSTPRNLILGIFMETFEKQINRRTKPAIDQPMDQDDLRSSLNEKILQILEDSSSASHIGLPKQFIGTSINNAINDFYRKHGRKNGVHLLMRPSQGIQMKILPWVMCLLIQIGPIQFFLTKPCKI